jgi:MFS family permease
LSLAGSGGMTILYTMANGLVSERTRSSDFGLLSSCVLAGQGVGSFAAGVLAAHDLRFVFLLNGGLFAAILLLFQNSRTPRPRGVGAPHRML